MTGGIIETIIYNYFLFFTQEFVVDIAEIFRNSVFSISFTRVFNFELKHGVMKANSFDIV